MQRNHLCFILTLSPWDFCSYPQSTQTNSKNMFLLSPRYKKRKLVLSGWGDLDYQCLWVLKREKNPNIKLQPEIKITEIFKFWNCALTHTPKFCYHLEDKCDLL